MHAEQTSDGGFVATGFTRKDITKDLHDAVLLRFTSKGETEWMKTFGTPEKDDQGYWIIAHAGGGYTLTGYTHSFGQNGDLWDRTKTNDAGN